MLASACPRKAPSADGETAEAPDTYGQRQDDTQSEEDTRVAKEAERKAKEAERKAKEEAAKKAEEKPKKSNRLRLPSAPAEPRTDDSRRQPLGTRREVKTEFDKHIVDKYNELKKDEGACVEAVEKHIGTPFMGQPLYQVVSAVKGPKAEAYDFLSDVMKDELMQKVSCACNLEHDYMDGWNYAYLIMDESEGGTKDPCLILAQVEVVHSYYRQWDRKKGKYVRVERNIKARPYHKPETYDLYENAHKH